MMITKFNKRKCLLKEIVKISELCFNKKQKTWEKSSIFNIFYSTAICCVIKNFNMHEHKVFVMFRGWIVKNEGENFRIGCGG